ncbi:protein kinase domain-containing protein [Paludisphaera mucosa]|uniref:Serine/threonine-protein kinase n=1 Tax=Paludisphaera mucosa TaxID=3030827 RepID=A0ABT6FEA4_9BACT|nr:serine/threonine-protein kinase [Paludisphaera mucosa]MDG3005916.1 serine/threonine-protein kinase [Paludisphaera mucosa]
MSAESRVQELLDEIADSGCTPEEACGACPELLPEVRRRWQQMRILKGELDALFPASDPDPDAEPSAPWHASAESLRIPGYDVEAVLGRGGMGVVYRARHLRLNRPVALKMMLAGPYAGPHERARFQREAEAVAGLRHANIVHVYDVGDHGGCPYFTMELVEGGSLAHSLAGTPQPARQAAALVTTLAEAVHAAHQAGIVHRDLKPANILLTASGTPKVADFGLARHFDADSALTLSGARIGTPSYMAPEQVLGEASSIGPAADVYALGALLYEMLTGRPPFRGVTTAETERQMVNDEPVAPSRLNTNVPRDLETICLKCISKEPDRRYAGAAALADDLKRFGEGRAIQARPLGWGERLWRWGRRNPTGAALLVTALALVGLASGGGVWLVQQRAERREEAAWRLRELRDEIGTSVAEAINLRQGFHFREARHLLEQARLRLEPSGPDDLRRRVARARADLELVEDLDRARLQAATLIKGKFETSGAELLYEKTWAKAFGRQWEDVQDVAARVRDSAVREEIVPALDDWASITRDPARRAWLLALAREADPDPSRDRLRQPELWEDGARLTRLFQETGLDDLSPQLATALGRVLRKKGDDAVHLLGAAQARRPQDFWLNFELGLALVESGRNEEALGFFRAALALRPEALPAHNSVGVSLGTMGRADEAIRYLQEALRIDPNFAIAHHNLGWVLSNKGRHDEAIKHYEEAIRLDPKRAGAAHTNLGLALWAKGRHDEAIKHYEEAIRLDPKRAGAAHSNLGLALWAKGRHDEAIKHYEEAIRLDPKRAGTADNLFTCRYAAACVAVQAAASLESRARTLGETERVDLRRRSLDWLRANLERRAEQLEIGRVVDWSSLSTRPLSDWQTDPALAGVRDATALATLPEAERKEWHRLWADVATLSAANPLEQGRAHAARREWDRAAADYARALARGPTEDGEFWFEYAGLLLLSGDLQGYARTCAHMIQASGKEGGPRAYHVARACTLAPDSVAESSLPGRLAEKELQDFAREFWSLTEQGALAYRAGKFQQSVLFFEQSLRADSRAGTAVLNWLWLALADQRLGKSEEARRWLGKAQAWLDQYGDGMPAPGEEKLGLHLHNWLEAYVLRREAEAVIPSKDLRGGTQSPGRGATPD